MHPPHPVWWHHRTSLKLFACLSPAVHPHALSSLKCVVAFPSLILFVCLFSLCVEPADNTSWSWSVCFMCMCGLITRWYSCYIKGWPVYEHYQHNLLPALLSHWQHRVTQTGPKWKFKVNLNNNVIMLFDSLDVCNFLGSVLFCIVCFFCFSSRDLCTV